nr:hypothetical protein Iba_chr01cCG5550 [Ipomoea batatas]
MGRDTTSGVTDIGAGLDLRERDAPIRRFAHCLAAQHESAPRKSVKPVTICEIPVAGNHFAAPPQISYVHLLSPHLSPFSHFTDFCLRFGSHMRRGAHRVAAADLELLQWRILFTSGNALMIVNPCLVSRFCKLDGSCTLRSARRVMVGIMKFWRSSVS